MKCSVLAILKRNHLPIVSVLGCISCLYILSQKDTLNEEIEINSRGFVKGLSLRGQRIDNEDPQEELNNNDKTLIEENQVEIADLVNDQPVETADQVEVNPDPVNPVPQVQAAPGELVISYNDPERVAFPGKSG